MIEIKNITKSYDERKILDDFIEANKAYWPELKQKEEIKMKILLCCNAGMSSSILVKKIRDVAEKTGEDIEVSAVANASIKNEVGKWDVCLVGPQLVFAVDSIHQQLNILHLKLHYHQSILLAIFEEWL